MLHSRIKIWLTVVVLLWLASFLLVIPASQSASAQQPTGSIPTVTGTATGPIIFVSYPEQINVRSGPSSRFYPTIGIMYPGEEAPALGRSPGENWLIITYFPGVPGNVGGYMRLLFPLRKWVFCPSWNHPQRPLQLTTPTIDPTLAAAFIIPATPNSPADFHSTP